MSRHLKRLAFVWVTTCLGVHVVLRIPYQFFHDGGKQEAANIAKGKDVLGNGGKGLAKIPRAS